MTGRIRLGFMTHVRSSAGHRQAYQDLTDLFIAADELGFDGGFIAVHHLAGADGGQLPSPLVFLASLADKTTRIGLGTSAIVLPLEDPIRLAEDVSVLDALSDGRVLLGLGTGGANLHRYAAYGKDAARASDTYFEKLEVLLDALAGGGVGGSDFRVTPPGPSIIERIWGTHGSPASARRAARHGTGVLYGTSDLDARTVQRPIAEAYLDEWSLAGATLAPEAVRSGLRPRLGAIRMIYPAVDLESARRESARGLREQAGRVAEKLGVAADDLSLEQIVAGLNMHLGSPDDIVGTMRDDPALLGHVEYVLPVVDTFTAGESPGTDTDRTIRAIEVMARDIAPRLGWRPSWETAADLATTA